MASMHWGYSLLLGQIRKHVNKGSSVLEVGCAGGDFVSELRIAAMTHQGLMRILREARRMGFTGVMCAPLMRYLVIGNLTLWLQRMFLAK